MFVPLRLHSIYSRGQGSITVDEALDWAARKRVKAMAITDVESFYGWTEWKKAGSDGRFKPVFGCELTLAGRKFIFLVKNNDGYRNLMELFNTREAHSLHGLVVIFLPEDGRVVSKSGNKIEERAASSAPPNDENSPVVNLVNKAEQDDFYLGADFANFQKIMSFEPPLSALPVVWANPLKFITSPGRLVLVHSIDKKIPYPMELNRLSPVLKLFGPEQAALAIRRFNQPAREALARTFEVAEKCSFSFDRVVPDLPPDIFPGSFRQVVTELLARRRDLSWKERQRARYELEVVEKSGFGPYFLIVHDIVSFARRRGILHNLRGSGASSFLAYLLGLSHVNPLEFDLYFERFLNPGRPDPPDIDLDFDSRRRDEVLTYALDKYSKGKTGAAFVCSLKKFRARSALYETLRSFGVPPEEARRLTGRIPFLAEPECLRHSPPAAGFLEAWKLAAELQGCYHEVALHVGGFIITPAPAVRFLPLQKSAKGLVMTHFDRDAVEDLKLIKLDLLSVRGLAAISEAREKIRLKNIPAADKDAYAALATGQTIGCFQVESPAMRNLLLRMKPANIHELTQSLALVRPGPTESGMKESLLRRRNGQFQKEQVGLLPDDLLARILPETEGILLYEEQVMQVAERVAGLSPAEADLLRRSLKKMKGGDCALKEKFFREAEGRGFGRTEVAKLWQMLERFSLYSFNKAHSASYAYMAYQAVYLKVHHPAVYLTAVLNAGGGYYDLPEYIAEAKRMGLCILPPDVNRSGRGFEVESDVVHQEKARGNRRTPAGPGKAVFSVIRVGLESILHLSRKTIDRIIEARQADGVYVSIEDFLVRVKPGRADLLALIRAGVFDSLEPQRTRQILHYFQGLRNMEGIADITEVEKKKMLYEALGFLPDGDELELFPGHRPTLRIKDLKNHDGQVVELVVRVVDARPRITYSPGGGRATDNGKPKYFYLFEDETGLLEGVGENRCVVYGRPPVCFLRGTVQSNNAGKPKVVNCVFLKSF